MKKPLITVAVVLMSLSVLAGCAALGFSSYQAPDQQTTGTAEVTAADDAGPASAPASQPSPTPDASGAPAGPSDAETPDADLSAVAVETDAYEYSSDYINVSMETPRVTGLPAAVGDAVNAVFSDYAQDVKANIDTFEQQCKSDMEQGYGTDMVYTIETGYDVMYLKDGLLSLTLTYYQYTGGAHGGTILAAYTFDLTTGDQLKLSDLMSGNDYKDFVNGVIRDEIDRRVADEELYELATFEDFGDSPQWFLTDDAVMIYFQQYEYFPYAAGIQTFTIPYAELQPYMNDLYMSHFFEFGSP